MSRRPGRAGRVLRLQEEDWGRRGDRRGADAGTTSTPFVADKLDGVQLMTLAEMLDIVEDQKGFERILQTSRRTGLRYQQRNVCWEGPQAHLL